MSYSPDEIQLMAEHVVYPSSTFDPTTRLPLIVMNSTALPKTPEEYTSELMERIIDRLPKSKYALVFFACGAPNKPSWAWVSKIYNMLDRQVKKRVDRVYVVHESWWVRGVTEMFRGVVSTKFKHKILHISCLSDLAKHIDITKINIVPAVYYHNLKAEPKITIPRHLSPVFGVPLRRNGSRVLYPSMWEDCCQYLKVTGINTRDIFTRSEDSITLILRDCYDRGQHLDLDDYGYVCLKYQFHLFLKYTNFVFHLFSPHQASCIIKMYLRELPNPILPIRYIPTPIQSNPNYIYQVFQSLPYVTQKFLSDLVPLFNSIIDNSRRTGHSSETLANALAPSLIGRYASDDDSMVVAIAFTKNLIELWYTVEERLIQYSGSDSSEFEEPVRENSRHRSPSSHHHNSNNGNESSRHPIQHTNKHEDGSLEITYLPPVPTARANGTPLSGNKTLRKIASLSSFSSSSSLSDQKTLSSTNDVFGRHANHSMESLGTPSPPPPPPPKLRKSASTILRPTTGNTHPPMPKLTSYNSFGCDLNKQQSNSNVKYKAPAKRGKLVAELAKLYEDKNIVEAEVTIETEKN